MVLSQVELTAQALSTTGNLKPLQVWASQPQRDGPWIGIAEVKASRQGDSGYETPTVGPSSSIRVEMGSLSRSS